MSRLLGSCRGFCTARTVTPLGAVYRAHGVPADVLNGTSKELLNGTFAKRVTHNPCTMTVESLPTLTLPGPGEVLLRMLAAPVNPADINQLEGKYPIQPALPAVGGNEGVAVIQEVWVLPPVGGGFGTWRTHAVAPASSLRLCPSGLTLEAAAQLSVNPVTALRLLTDFVELKPGDVVIQNAANSAVGRAVLQLACARGLRVVCLVRDRPGIQAVMEELRAMGAAAVACTSSLDGGSSKKRQEALRGLPPGALGLNAVGGPSACEVARLLAPGATMVTYGGMSKQSVELSTGAFIFRDLRARGFWLTAWTRTASPADVTKALEECATAMRDGKLIAAPTQVVHGLQALPDALRAAGSPGGIKLLVRMDV